MGNRDQGMGNRDYYSDDNSASGLLLDSTNNDPHSQHHKHKEIHLQDFPRSLTQRRKGAENGALFPHLYNEKKPEVMSDLRITYSPPRLGVSARTIKEILQVKSVSL